MRLRYSDTEPKLAAFISMYTSPTSAAKPSASSPPVPEVARRMIQPPASGKATNVIAFHSVSRTERRRATSSASTETAPMNAAGAGPSSAIASTSARNDPDMRTRRSSIVIASLPIASTSSSSTR